MLIMTKVNIDVFVIDAYVNDNLWPQEFGWGHEMGHSLISHFRVVTQPRLEWGQEVKHS